MPIIMEGTRPLRGGVPSRIIGMVPSIITIIGIVPSIIVFK